MEEGRSATERLVKKTGVMAVEESGEEQCFILSEKAWHVGSSWTGGS